MARLDRVSPASTCGAAQNPIPHPTSTPQRATGSARISDSRRRGGGGRETSVGAGVAEAGAVETRRPRSWSCPLFGRWGGGARLCGGGARGGRRGGGGGGGGGRGGPVRGG